MGFGLFLDDGRITFLTKAGMRHDLDSIHQTEPGLISVQTWHHVVASWDGKHKRIYVDGRLAGQFPFSGQVHPGGPPSGWEPMANSRKLLTFMTAISPSV